MRISAAMKLPPPPLESRQASQTVWFAPRSCVVVKNGRREIFIGGQLLGGFEAGDTARRNLLAVVVAEGADVHLGAFARGLGLSQAGLRLIRREAETGGFAAVQERKRGAVGGSRVPAAVRRKVEKLFSRGASVTAAHDAVAAKVPSRSTVGLLRLEWAAQQESESPGATTAAPATESLKPTPESVPMPEASVDLAPPDEGADVRVQSRPPQSAPMVQHVGSWMLLGMVNSLGLHRRAMAATAQSKKPVPASSLRVALDAVVVALALGEKCVEGVRRLATATATTLLLASRAPSASWVRGVMGRLAQEEQAGLALHLGMAREYVEAAGAAAAQEGPVFYVDNHMRPYTGQQTVRKGWRMQDKRVRPGASDYYVHDEDGRAVGRFSAPHHGALTDFLTPAALLLRLALPEETILLAFDRAGAFPVQLSELRDEGFEFVTYERRPYALLAEGAFTESITRDGEKLLLYEEEKRNLGGGRGRVRRICVRTEDGRQINLLAVSKRPAARLLDVMRGRWVQENGFKHAKERWGINQLDGRSVESYPPDTIIPNPARRRLDEGIRIARAREGLARVELARLPDAHDKRALIEATIVEAVAEQERLLELRPSMPKKAALRDTDLAGELVHHTLEYKLVMDTVRIACINAEAELAAALAPALPRGAEAKKVLANVFAAPGRVAVGDKAITLTLQPAANSSEREALESLFKRVNELNLCLPGDQRERPLRFSLHHFT
jgi:hypothetical protein